MTLNQLEYFKYLESKRTNRANENIKQWYNEQAIANQTRDLARREEELKNQQRLADISQLEANTKVRQAEIAQQNADTNRFKAEEDKRHALTNEYYNAVSARQNTQSLDIARQNAETNRINALTGITNAQTNQASVGVASRQAGASELNARANMIGTGMQFIQLPFTMGKTKAEIAVDYSKMKQHTSSAVQSYAQTGLIGAQTVSTVGKMVASHPVLSAGAATIGALGYGVYKRAQKSQTPSYQRQQIEGGMD